MNNNDQNSNQGVGFHVHVNSPGNNIAQQMTITINGNVYNGQAQQAPRQYTDEQVAQALTNIVGKGKAIDSKQKWAGAHWMLRWACNFPARPQDFCERIDRMKLPETLEFKCDYNNIRPISTLSFMNEDSRNLDNVRYSRNDEQMYFQMRAVVIALREELKKIASE